MVFRRQTKLKTRYLHRTEHNIKLRHAKTGLKSFVVVIPKKDFVGPSSAKLSSGVTPNIQ